jgi:hypothetical protein
MHWRLHYRLNYRLHRRLHYLDFLHNPAALSSLLAHQQTFWGSAITNSAAAASADPGLPG